MAYESSRYNFFVLYKKDNYLLYNARSNALALVDQDMKKAFEQNDEEALMSLPEEYLTVMTQRGFLIDDTIDEIHEIEYRHHHYIVNNFSNVVELALIMTYGCNLACTYCYEKGINLKKTMSKNMLDRVEKYIKTQAVRNNARKIVSVSFYGGEPLFNWKGCKYTMNFLKECNREYETPYETRVITNGLLLTDDVLQTFLDNNIVSMQITLDGAKKDHDKRRKTPRGEGTYDAILDRITTVYEIDQNLPRIRINIDNTNYHGLPMLFDDLSERGLCNLSVYFGIVFEFTRGCKTGDSSCFDLESIEKTLPDLWRLALSKGYVIKTRPSTMYSYCGFDLAHAFVIDPFGDFYNCWNAIGMKEWCIGSLDSTGKLVSNHNFYDQLSREPTRFEECSTCTLLPACMGGCAFLANSLHGTIHSAGCGEYKNIIGERLKWYVEREYAHILEEGEEDEAVQI